MRCREALRERSLFESCWSKVEPERFLHLPAHQAGGNCGAWTVRDRPQHVGQGLHACLGNFSAIGQLCPAIRPGSLDNRLEAAIYERQGPLDLDGAREGPPTSEILDSLQSSSFSMT